MKIAPIPINHAISFLSFRFLPSGLNDVSSGLTSPLDVLDSFGHQPGTLFSGLFQRGLSVLPSYFLKRVPLLSLLQNLAIRVWRTWCLLPSIFFLHSHILEIYVLRFLLGRSGGTEGFQLIRTCLIFLWCKAHHARPLRVSSYALC